MGTRGIGTPRQCPVDGPGVDQCTRSVRAGYLMCGGHWRQVPKDVQNRVWRTWRAFNRDGTAEQWTDYADAREDALAAVAQPAPTEEETSERPW